MAFFVFDPIFDELSNWRISAKQNPSWSVAVKSNVALETVVYGGSG